MDWWFREWFPDPVERLLNLSLPDWDIRKVAQQIRDMLVDLWLSYDGNECREVYDLFPENYDIDFWEIRNSTNPNWATLESRERSITIDGKNFILKEIPWDSDALHLIQAWEFFELPDKMKEIKSFRVFILRMLKDRKKVLALEGLPLENTDLIDRAIRTKMLTLKSLGYGQSHLSLSKNVKLTKNWEFLFWYILYYDKSLEK